MSKRGVFMKLALFAMILISSLSAFARWSFVKKMDANENWLKSDEVIMRASLSPNEKKAAFLVYYTSTGGYTVQGRVLIVDTRSMKVVREVRLPTFYGTFSNARFSDSRTDLIKCFSKDSDFRSSRTYWLDPEIWCCQISCVNSSSESQGREPFKVIG